MSFNRGEYWIIATACIHRRIAVLDISPLDIATHSEHVFFWVVFFGITDFGFSKWFIWLATQNKTNKKSNNKRLNWSKWGKKKKTSWSTNKCNPVNLSKLSLIEKEEGGGRREEGGGRRTERKTRLDTHVKLLHSACGYYIISQNPDLESFIFPTKLDLSDDFRNNEQHLQDAHLSAQQTFSNVDSNK